MPSVPRNGNQSPSFIRRLASTRSWPRRSASPARSALMIFSISRGNAVSSRRNWRIRRLASSIETGSAVRTISHTVSRFWRGVGSFMKACLVGESWSPAVTVPFPRRREKCDTAECRAFRQGVPRRSRAVATGGLRAAHVGLPSPQPRSALSPTGRRRSRLSPPPPVKSRVIPRGPPATLPRRLVKSPPVPRSIRCAPGARRYNASVISRLVARKHHMQRRAALSGPPVPFFHLPARRPRRSRAAGWPTIPRIRMPATARHAGLP